MLGDDDGGCVGGGDLECMGCGGQVGFGRSQSRRSREEDRTCCVVVGYAGEDVEDHEARFICGGVFKGRRILAIA